MVIGVASQFVETVLDQAIDLGVRAATIFASCYLEHDDQPALPARIAAKAAKAGMSLCGANCMGFYTPSVGLRVASAASPEGLQQGGIATLSGSAFGALSHNDRRLWLHPSGIHRQNLAPRLLITWTGRCISRKPGL